MVLLFLREKSFCRRSDVGYYVKKEYLVLVLFFFSGLLFSEENSFKDMELASKIEYISNAVKTMDPDFIDEIYNYEKSDPDYDSLIEVLVEKAGNLVFQKEYDYAFKIIEGVLYNNLNNVQAQELYLVLNDILKEEAEQKRIQLEAEKEKERLRLEAEAEQEKKRLEEEERLRQQALAEEEQARKLQEQEKLRQEEEARFIAEKKAQEEEYQASLQEQQKQLEEAEAYKSSITTVGAKNFSFYTILFPGDLLYYTSEVYAQYNPGGQQESVLFGSGAQGGITFTHPVVNVNLDIDFDFGYLGINKTGSKNITYSTNLSIGSEAIFIPLTIRLGFFYNQYLYDNSSVGMAIVKFPTPSFGIGLWNLKITDNFKIDCAVDYYFAPLVTDQLDLAFGGELAISYRILKFNRLSIHVC